MSKFINTNTQDIVTLAVAYMRLGVQSNKKVSDYLTVNDKGFVSWKDYEGFQNDILNAFRELGVPCCDDYWHFIEVYMAGFSWSDDVLHLDIMTRFLDGELDDEEDIEWCESNFNDKENMKEWCEEKESEFFQYALFDFFVRTNHR